MHVLVHMMHLHMYTSYICMYMCGWGQPDSTLLKKGIKTRKGTRGLQYDAKAAYVCSYVHTHAIKGMRGLQYDSKAECV